MQLQDKISLNYVQIVVNINGNACKTNIVASQLNLKICSQIIHNEYKDNVYFCKYLSECIFGAFNNCNSKWFM